MPDLLVLVEPMPSILCDFAARLDPTVLLEFRDVPGAPVVFVAASPVLVEAPDGFMPPESCASANVLESAKVVASAIVVSFICRSLASG